MKRKNLTNLLVLVIIILVVGIGWLGYKRGWYGSGAVVKDSGSNVSDYSAVFLTNDQVYFGKMTKDSDQEVTLTDIYYLKVNQQIQPDTSGKATPTPSGSASPNIVLVKLGSELHGPNDVMHISKSQVLFVESMKTDSQVVKAINDNKAK